MLRRRPETGAAVIVVLAWLVLVTRTWRDERHSMAGMPGMSAIAAQHDWTAVGRALFAAMLMTVAMMGPAALGGIQHTGRNSLRWRRRRAMAEFASGYLVVWLGYGIVSLLAADLLAVPRSQATLCTALLVAAGWQFTPYKRRWLRDCHLSVPLPPRGWRAEKAALTFGTRNGLSCLGSCWCLMSVMSVAPSGTLLWSVALSGLITTERLLQRPRRATRLAGAALGTAGLWTLALALS